MPGMFQKTFLSHMLTHILFIFRLFLQMAFLAKLSASVHAVLLPFLHFTCAASLRCLQKYPCLETSCIWQQSLTWFLRNLSEPLNACLLQGQPCLVCNRLRLITPGLDRDSWQVLSLPQVWHFADASCC